MLTLARRRGLNLRSHLYLRPNSTGAGPNQSIVDFLKRCQQEEERIDEPNGFKVRAYGNAIQSLSQVSQPIKLGTDVAKLPGIGSSIATKISEFLYASEEAESRHPKLEEELSSARALQMLLTVPGIGPTSAKKLIAAGCTTIADLRLPFFLSMLSKKQQAKVKFMGHLEKPITRPDAEDLLSFCSDNLDPRYGLTLVGDYRRGFTSLPEIQLMVTHPDFVHIPLPSSFSSSDTSQKGKPRTRKRESKQNKQQSLLLSEVVPVLQQRGLIAETLSSGSDSWEGIIRIPELRGEWGDRMQRIEEIENISGNFRRMVINFVSYKSRGVALLHLTGDSDFLKHMAYQAKQSGMLLNEHGLWNWNYTHSETPFEDPNGETLDPNTNDEEGNGNVSSPGGYWSLLGSEREKDVFDELGMDFVDPTKRNFTFVSGKVKRKKRTSP